MYKSLLYIYYITPTSKFWLFFSISYIYIYYITPTKDVLYTSLTQHLNFHYFSDHQTQFWKGPSNDHSTKVWFKLAQWLQRSWLKCEKLTDGRRSVSHWANLNQTLVEWSLDGPFQNCVWWSQLPTKMATKLKIEKRGDEILIVHCCFSISQNELKF
jgi:hypothetical protein